ncbi:hypothetical protein [Catenuloplanes indicus]|uniref:Uncharacterized protein n=1 Tax=Catenuloplanes indicus TaxID=137267 RepID=A0AAE3VTG4_9ACTN|nr:hypothetical protein [Catenuloplanes indicus]MDQ0363386.1 hypothetical protein [Catenuloplanes indicus]
MTITTSDVDDVLAACIAAGLPHPRGIVTDGTAIRFHMATAADVDTYAERLDASPVVDGDQTLVEFASDGHQIIITGPTA